MKESMLCDGCREKAREQKKAYERDAVNRAITNGLCRRCKKNKVENGFWRCRTCRLKRSDDEVRRYETRKANGLCVTCGVNPVSRFVQCGECRRSVSKKRTAVAV